MTTHYTLYIGSKNTLSGSLRPRLAMTMAKLAFDEVLIPLRRPETKSRIEPHSPLGKVRALKIAENGATETVWDSLAICETLAERHGPARLWPQDECARAEARSIAAEMHAGFSNLRNLLPMDSAARHPTPALDDAVQAEIARVVAIWQSALSRFGRGGGFLFGPFSIADAFYAPVVTRFETYGIHLPAVARAYTQRVLTLAPMREWAEAVKAELVTSL